MSTNSRIYLKLKEEDKAKKEMQANPSLFEAEEWNYNTPSVIVPKDAKYISIYCHWDGYPSGVGIDLFKFWKEYDKILNLLLVGFISYLEEEKFKSYYAWRGGLKEKWEDVQPNFTEDTNFVEHYNYLFDYETNMWYIGGKNKWEPLEDYLREHNLID